MTENEKLRALLAEARAALSQGCWNGKCCAVRKRIDDSLAEPVSDGYVFRGGYIEDASGDRWWSAELLAKTERERDEARAEVERARSKGFTEGHAAGRQAAFDGEVTNADIQRAYRRGAEAMRKAAADIFDAPVNTPGREELFAWAESIRALPIPEDK